MIENDVTLTIANLHDLLDYNARKFTNAEIQLRNSLNEWIVRASSLKLKAVLQKYLDFIQLHVLKLEGFFVAEQISSLSSTNRIMKSFIEETEEKLNNCVDAEVKDACLLASVQDINHFKISLYGTAAAFARELNMDKFASVFHEAEINEKQIDDRLSQLAEHEINTRAKAPILLNA
jgi:ferritin-like metal-binding protein YciE